jgi:ABC-2 type transport system permease protein
MRFWPLFLRQLSAQTKWRPHLYMLFVQPMVYLFLFGTMMETAVPSIEHRGIHVPYLTFVLPGLIAMQAFNHFSTALTETSNERRWGVLRQYALLSVHPVDYIAAKFLANWCVLVCQVIMMVTGTWIMGHSAGTFVTVLAMMAVASVASFTWTSLGVGIGILIEHEEKRSTITTLVTLPVIMTASVFYSMETAPPVLLALSWMNPLNYQAKLMREVLLGLTDGSKGGIALVFAICFGVFLAVLALARRVELDG